MEQRYLVGRKQVLAHVAHWAVRQSPYTCPDGLPEALTELDRRLAESWKDPLFERVTEGELRDALRETLLTIPQVLAWNEPKAGGDAPFLLVCAFSQVSPDRDFIDLDALLRNVVNGIVREEREAMRLPDPKPIAVEARLI